MILVTHEMKFARNVANHIVFLADGVIDEQGTPDEIFGNPKSERLKKIHQLHPLKPKTTKTKKGTA